MMTNTNIYNKQDMRKGMLGLILGDALGCPVQFKPRKARDLRPVTGMEGFGTYHKPAGTWTDDSSMALATLASIKDFGCINSADIMYRFAAWLLKGDYTPFGESFDVGGGTHDAISRYLKNPDYKTCGGTSERDNGNGSLMRILPICVYLHGRVKNGTMDVDKAVSLVHQVSGLTHNHMRSKVACGLYFFMVGAIVDGSQDGGTLQDLLQRGLDHGFAFYDGEKELNWYRRLRDLDAFADTTRDKIRSSGYVVDTLEAAVWSLITTDSFKDALLTAVNLGDDTDSVGAVCGGLAGLYYGEDQMPADWTGVIQNMALVDSII